MKCANRPGTAGSMERAVNERQKESVFGKL